MNLRILEYFLMVAETGNITKAAEQLLMTQPTLSRQLKQLEEELGVDLFTRKNHHIELTEEGLLFRRRAQELVDLADKAKQELKEESELSGDLHIGLREGQSVKEISQLVQEFHTLYPAVRFHFFMGDNADIRDGLDRGELDFGLLLEPTPRESYDFVRIKTKEEWGVLLPEASSLASQEGIVQGDLVGSPVITIKDRLVQQDLISWSGATAAQMHNFARYNMLSSVLTLARQTKAPLICLRPSEDYQDLIFVPLSPLLEASSILAWKTQPVAPRLFTIFQEFLQEKYKN